MKNIHQAKDLQTAVSDAKPGREQSRTAQASHATRVLRCRKTQRYFTGHSWSDDSSQALIFPDQIDAIRVCVSNSLFDVDLVLRADARGADFFSTSIR